MLIKVISITSSELLKNRSRANYLSADLFNLHHTFLVCNKFNMIMPYSYLKKYYSSFCDLPH